MTISFNHKSKLSIVGTGSYVFRHYGIGGGGSLTYTYTGTVEERDITFEGTDYKILMLTTDGDLSFSRPVTCDIWACGGGSNGISANRIDHAAPGGAGAYCSESDGVQIQNINVIIGPANTASGTIITGDTSLTAAGVANNKNGGTGGGGGGGHTKSSNVFYRGTGDKKSKYPFLDEINFQPHCAGGGGGAASYYTSSTPFSYYGANGGTNGKNGTISSSTKHNNSGGVGGTGGNFGGGTGGYSSYSSPPIPTYPTAATFYGSGGGGGSYATYRISGSNTSQAYSYGGNGYQGVCYIRIPASEF